VGQKVTTTMNGIYYVVVVGAYNAVLDSSHIASQTVFVTPESALGALTATVAAFAAFGIFGWSKVTIRKL
jgi:hypothetical protein